MPNAAPVSLGNTHLLPLGVKPVAGTGNPRTIGSACSRTSTATRLWAGTCSDADPRGREALGRRLLPGREPLRPRTVMTPGQSSTGTVQLPALQVTVKKSGVVKSGYAVTATHVVPSGATSDPGCPTAEAYTLGTSNGERPRLDGAALRHVEDHRDERREHRQRERDPQAR